VRVFLRLGDPELLEAGIAHHLAEDPREGLRLKDDRAVVRGVVLGERDVVHRWRDFPVKAGKVRLEKGDAELPRTIGAEIEEEHDIAIAHALLITLGKDQRRHELITRGSEQYAAATASEGLTSHGWPRPSTIASQASLSFPSACRGPWQSSARPRRDKGAALLEPSLQSSEILLAARRRSIATIGDRVHENLADSEAAAASASATRCSMWLCTPPSETSPTRCSLVARAL
jgi:hypothetical protein